MEWVRILAWMSLGWVAGSLLRPTPAQSLVESPDFPAGSPPLDDGRKQRLATTCLREGKSLIYIAICPWHKPTADTGSTGRCFSWDVETGMAHCLWCGWGGRVAQPLPGPVHPDLLPTTFRLVLVT